MLFEKWSLLREYVDGMVDISEGNVKKALQKVQAKIDLLDKKEKEERNKFTVSPEKATKVEQ